MMSKHLTRTLELTFWLTLLALIGFWQQSHDNLLEQGLSQGPESALVKVIEA